MPEPATRPPPKEGGGKKPPEGPHAKPKLIDPQKTPGSGMFPDDGSKDTEAPGG
jgi:hypothetical protein